jgi:hypothetical protein
MRVCYLSQAHRQPRQIARLARTLGRMSPGALLLIVHDDTGCAIDPATVRGDAETHCLPVRGPLRRGYLSLLDPWLSGIEWLRRRGLDYDWLVYLSGRDYPTLPLGRSEAALAAAECDGFLRWWPALGPGGPWSRRRQGSRRYYLHLAYGPRVGDRARKTPFVGGRVCYAGWQWTTLRRSCAERVLETVERDRALVAYYRCTVCPDVAGPDDPGQRRRPPLDRRQPPLRRHLRAPRPGARPRRRGSPRDHPRRLPLRQEVRPRSRRAGTRPARRAAGRAARR